MPQWREAWKKLEAQAVEHSVAHKKLNPDWNAETCFKNALMLHDDLLDAGVQPLVRFGRGSAKAITEAVEDPELAAQILFLRADAPDMTIKDIMEKTHAPRRMVSRILKEVTTKYPTVVHEVEKLSNRGIIDALNEKIKMAFQYLDDEAFDKMTGNQIAVALGIMIDKRQLLSGEPTAILSVQERSNLNELMPALLNEANRRQGILIEGEVVE